MKNINGLNEIEQQVLFIDDVEKIIGRNRLTLRRWWMDGKFPLPVKLNCTTLAWHREAVVEWIERNVKSFF
jgi:prophage regulatory protein